MERRTFVSTLAAGSAIALSGCVGSSEEDAQLVNTYTEGYRKFEAADKTGSNATNFDGRMKVAMRERSSELYAAAESRFEGLIQETEGNAKSICDEAERHCQLMKASLAEHAKGNTTRSLTHQRNAAEHEVAEPKRLQSALSTFGSPGDATVGEVTAVPPEDIETATPRPQPAIQWREESAGDGIYRVSIAIVLDGAPGASIVDVPVDGGENRHIATVSEDGAHVIAGQGSGNDPLTGGTRLMVEVADDTKTSVEIGGKFGDYIVGSGGKG